MKLSELLLYGFIVGAVLLFNLLMKWLARRAKQRQQEPDQAGPLPQPPAPPLPATLETQWGRKALPATPIPLSLEERPRRPPSPRVDRPVPAAAPGHRPARAPLFRTRSEFRRAVVTMTVLGPCRAQQPYDQGPT